MHSVLLQLAINDYLSMLNSRKQRSMRAVYSKLRKSPTYLSLDFESGGFEVFDKNGLHLGQYSFDGARTKVPAPDTHKLVRFYDPDGNLIEVGTPV